MSPVSAQITEVPLVLTLRNTANRNLTAAEENEFKYVKVCNGLFFQRYPRLIPNFGLLSRDELLAFFFLHAWDDVKVEKVEVWYQQQVQWLEEVFERERRIQELAATAVSLILTVSHYGSHSDSEIGDKFVELLEEAEVQVVNLMRGREEFPFFFQVDAMHSRVIDAVTYAPVAAPGLEGKDAVAEIITQKSEERKGGNMGGGLLHLFRLLICADLLITCSLQQQFMRVLVLE